MANVQRFWPSQKVSNWLSAGIAWSGSTANGLATYSSATEIVAESTATYDGTTLELTTSGGGLKLDGLDSSDVNTLDDYEEGYWTAGVWTTGGSITLNSAYDQGSYTKIGRMVHIAGFFDVSATSSPTGELKISGLPFTSATLNERADYWSGSGCASDPGSDTGAEKGVSWALGSNTTYPAAKSTWGNEETFAEEVDDGTWLRIGLTYFV